MTYEIGDSTRIHHLLDKWITSQPDALALRDPSISLTYAQLDKAADSVVEQLISLGVRAGDRVLVIGENCALLSAVWIHGAFCRMLGCLIERLTCSLNTLGRVAFCTPTRYQPMQQSTLSAEVRRL
jgi:acyl-CoA synthetase (AMP-forming)/AMP-acid ligase II